MFYYEKYINPLEWWLYTFQNLNRLQEIPKRFKGDIIERVFDKAEFINLPKEEKEKYHKNLKVYRDLINSIDTARAEGRVKGKIEEKIEIAKASLAQNIDIKTIALITGLSEEEIKEL